MNKAEQKIYYPWLDGVRFFAALAVCISHARGFFLPAYGDLPIQYHSPGIFVFYILSRLGHESVIIFFVLSGFLVGGPTIKRINDRTFDLRQFAVNRLARIFPPLFGSLLLLYGASFFLGYPNLFQVLGNLLSLQGILCYSASAPLWALSYEVWFYVLIACIGAFCCATGGKKNWSFLSILVCMAVFCKLSFLYLLIWMEGAISYFLMCDRSKKDAKLHLKISFIFLLFAVFLELMSSKTETTVIRLALAPKYADLILGFAMSYFLVSLARSIPQSAFAKKMDCFFKKAAAFSYSLYLSHYVVFCLLSRFGIGRAKTLSAIAVGIFCMSIILAIAVASAFYWCFEKRTPFYKQVFSRMLFRKGHGA